MNFVYIQLLFGIILLNNINLITSNKLECTEELTNQVIGEKCFTFIQTITTWSQQYRSVISTDATVWCHRKVKSIMEGQMAELQRLVDERVLSTGTSHLTSLDEMIAILQNARNEYTDPNNTETSIGEIVYALRLNDYETARTNYLRLGKVSLSPLVNAFYEKNIKSATILSNFLSTLPNIDDTYLGYRLLATKMIEYNQLYSTLSTILAYRIRNDTIENANLYQLRTLLPPTAVSFPFNNTLKIRNFKFNEALFANTENYNYDVNRRKSLTYSYAPCTSAYCQWTLTETLNGTYFHLRNVATKEYLYSDADDLASDTKRHSVFTWRKLEEPSEQGRWEIEPVEGTEYFKIKNSYWGEYLYVDEDKIASYHYTFTLSNDNCNHDGCKWSFIKM